uniref:IPT/TIG domain-containing protein n=1 Tax=Pedobacter schmidteae TaxID=2201271 RepID=UPI000EB42952|nr:IPT/TIG domain-containing protein [Pedobacter schmidteae]
MKKIPNYFIVLFACCFSFSGCKDKGPELDYDSGKPPVFSSFSPKEGAVRTRFFIQGSNFGTDISKIEVYIGDHKLNVIGSDGRQIYCMVPRNSASGRVKVVINRDPRIEYVFDEEFTYKMSTTVGTLAGSVDELGNSSIVDGSFSEARFSFSKGTWLTYEPKENKLFVTEKEFSVRLVDLNEKTVRTLITNGQASFKKIQSSTLSFDSDTLFIVDDNGQSNTTQVAIAYTLRSENFRRVQPYIYDRTSYSCAAHPIHNIMFFNTYWGGGIQKAYTDPQTGTRVSKELFKVAGNNNVAPNIFFHPTGNYVYFVIANCIWKSMYNWQNKELESPIIFAGLYNTTGDVDAIGTSARFGYLRQGVFVKNAEYSGQADEYDFYVTDINNHSIRKITPIGQVSTFAGKGSPSADGKKDGYIDGDPRKEARFNKPNGIAYDEQRKIFYIAEELNKRIRTISVE